MSRETPQPAAIVDHRSTDAIHHPTQREGELPSWLRVVPAPARRLALELRAHLRPAVVGRPQFVRLEVLQTPVRTGLQPDDVQSVSRQQWRDEPAHASDSDQDNISTLRR